MRSPFRSERSAFLFVLLTALGLGVTALAAALGGTWAGFGVWAAVTAAVAGGYLRGRPARVLRTAPPHTGGPDERTLLVLADAPPPEDAPLEKLTGGATRILVVSPARTSFLHRWVSDVDGSRSAAHRTLDLTLERLRDAHVRATGVVGDEDPVRAVEDALRRFGADELVVSTRAGTADELVSRLRRAFALPVTAVVGPAGNGDRPAVRR